MLHRPAETDLALLPVWPIAVRYQGPEAVPMRILLPAYVTSELENWRFRSVLQIFHPLLIIILVIASVLMALGMMMGATSDNRPTV